MLTQPPFCIACVSPNGQGKKSQAPCQARGDEKLIGSALVRFPPISVIQNRRAALPNLPVRYGETSRSDSTTGMGWEADVELAGLFTHKRLCVTARCDNTAPNFIWCLQLPSTCEERAKTRTLFCSIFNPLYPITAVK